MYKRFRLLALDVEELVEDLADFLPAFFKSIYEDPVGKLSLLWSFFKYTLIGLIGVVVSDTIKQLGHDAYKIFHALFKFIDKIYDALGIVIKFVNTITSLLGLGAVLPKKLHLENFIDIFKHPATMCSEFKSVQAEVLFIPRATMNHWICPIPRFFYGTWLWHPFAFIFGWGFEDARPPPHGNNCKLHLGEDIICFLLEAPQYLILDMLIWLYLFLLFQQELWPLILDILSIGYEILRILLHEILMLVFILIYPSFHNQKGVDYANREKLIGQMFITNKHARL